MKSNANLAEAIMRHTEVMEEYIKIERQKRRPWSDPEEAAEILGLNISPSRKHRRKLSAMVDRGLITKFRDGRPPMYWKAELQQLAIRRAEGKIVY